MIKVLKIFYVCIFVLTLGFCLMGEAKGFAQTTGIGTDISNIARVDQVAPDFIADAYHDGAFKRVSLKDYRDKWVLLCFYPGDFTFV